MPTAKIKDIQMYYETCGTGQPLLLIAGLGCDIQAWLTVIPQLAKDFQVIAFDNRGVGRSDIPETSYTIRQMAEDTVGLVDYLNIKTTDIMGHSMGGYIAQEIAINYPERVRKLILESTAPASSARNDMLLDGFVKWHAGGMRPEDWVESWTYWLFGTRKFEDKEFITAYIKNGVEYPYFQPQIGFKRQVEAIAAFDAGERIGKIKAETLVVEGREDILIPPREAELLVRGIPRCFIRYVEDAGHAVNLEKPEEVARIVSDFLQGA